MDCDFAAGKSFGSCAAAFAKAALSRLETSLDYDLSFKSQGGHLCGSKRSMTNLIKLDFDECISIEPCVD